MGTVQFKVLDKLAQRVGRAGARHEVGTIPISGGQHVSTHYLARGGQARDEYLLHNIKNNNLGNLGNLGRLEVDPWTGGTFPGSQDPDVLAHLTRCSNPPCCYTINRERAL